MFLANETVQDVCGWPLPQNHLSKALPDLCLGSDMLQGYLGSL